MSLKVSFCMMQGNVVYMKKSQLPDYNRLSRQLKFVRIIA